MIFGFCDAIKFIPGPGDVPLYTLNAFNNVFHVVTLHCLYFALSRGGQEKRVEIMGRLLAFGVLPVSGRSAYLLP
jgi:hypothetical protein